MLTKMKKTPHLHTQTSEPLIVVEADPRLPTSPLSTPPSSDTSPTYNPYLLAPYAREVRKHSLPTPQCAGITASQVRRLSERGDSQAPGPRQTEFLATLSSAPTPSSGGRRHSVVTISKVPFGRARRDSFSPAPPVRLLPNRRESIACPPSTEPRGSVHNLQLDIMDDIVQARKVRMKVWNTSSERVCEVQPAAAAADEDVQRYSRRYSDFVGTPLAPIPARGRRASELPSPMQPSASAAVEVVESEPGKVVWDGRSGSLVDAHALGSAIEGFLRQADDPPKDGAAGGKTAGRSKSWFSKQDGGGDGDDGSDSTETCDSSLCSTLKDLFVK